jgi:hypothetical protein
MRFSTVAPATGLRYKQSRVAMVRDDRALRFEAGTLFWQKYGNLLRATFGSNVVARRLKSRYVSATRWFISLLAASYPNRST